MEKKILYINKNEKNLRYVLFEDHNKIYYIDMYYKRLLTILFPFLVYKIKFPLIEINSITSKDLMLNIKEEKHHFFWSFLILIPFLNNINDFNMNIAHKNIIILGFMIFFIGLLTGFFIFDRKFKLKHIPYTYSHSYIIFKVNWKLLIFYTIIEISIYTMIYFSIQTFIFNSTSLNIMMLFLTGFIFMIITFVPYNICRLSEFEIIEKKDKSYSV